ncbi:MAG: hypothetical protein V2B19_21195 [Pseudomonadota bacterium]
MGNATITRLDRIEKNLEEFTKGMFALKEAQLKTDAQQNRTDAQILELKEAQLRTDAQILELKEAMRETTDKFEITQKLLGDLGLVQGEIAEDLFYRNVKGLFSPLDLCFRRIRRNVKVNDQGEYDIVADEKGRVLVIEVKNKLSLRMVDDFMKKKLPRFKTLLPEYRDSKILAGVGSLVVRDDVGRYAEKAGLFVLTQTSDGGAALLNRKGFKPKEFA